MDKKTEAHYALYRANGFVSAVQAEKTNFSEEDLEILWDSIVHMFDFDRCAVNGKFRMRKLIIFKHSSRHGNVPAHILFEKVIIEKKKGVEMPCQFSDYMVTLKEMPEGVEVIEKL